VNVRIAFVLGVVLTESKLKAQCDSYGVEFNKLKRISVHAS
jgi:hypothetical protein